MNGTPALWLPGTDHAAIATETVVLKNLGVSSREEFTRPEFMQKCLIIQKKHMQQLLDKYPKWEQLAIFHENDSPWI